MNLKTAKALGPGSSNEAACIPHAARRRGGCIVTQEISEWAQVTNRADPLFLARRDQIVALAARGAIPALYPVRDFAVAGGLMSYGTDFADSYHQCGIYAGRIVGGEKPADLPVQRSVKFEIVINLKTAKALGLSIPNSMQLLADEMIE
jgi:putative tryptophan/tyrosine transport system substrate-binding protein